MLWFLLSIIMATSAGVTLFLFLVSGDMSKFKQRFNEINTSPDLPIITKDGHILDTKEDLDEQLTVLKGRLEAKQSDLLTSKSRILTAAESIQKLQVTSDQVRRYYLRLRTEIERSEGHCKSLQEEISEYKKKRQKVIKDGKFNEKGDPFIKSVCKDLSRTKPEPTLDSSLKTYSTSKESSFYPDFQNMYSTN